MSSFLKGRGCCVCFMVGSFDSACSRGLNLFGEDLRSGCNGVVGFVVEPF